MQLHLVPEESDTPSPFLFLQSLISLNMSLTNIRQDYTYKRHVGSCQKFSGYKHFASSNCPKFSYLNFFFFWSLWAKSRPLACYTSFNENLEKVGWKEETNCVSFPWSYSWARWFSLITSGP